MRAFRSIIPLWAALLLAPAIGLYSAEAQTQTQTGLVRRPRPPPDYRGRAQIVLIGEQPPPPDTRKPEIREHHVGKDLARKPTDQRSMPRMLPAPQPEPEEMPLTVRDWLRDSLQTDKGPRAKPSGWGWLADEINTNRALRIRKEKKSEEEEDLFAADALGGTASVMTTGELASLTLSIQESLARWRNEPQARTQEVAQTQDRYGERGDRGGLLSPALGSFVPALDPGRVADLGVETRRPDARRWEGEPEQSLIRPEFTFNRNLFGESSAGMGSSLRPLSEWGLSRPVAEEAKSGPRENARENAAPGRETREAFRFDSFQPPLVPSPSAFQSGLPSSSGSSLWSPPAFSPLGVMPTESSLSSLPTPSIPVGASPGAASIVPSFGEANRSSLGGMGSALERPVPRTLPW